MGLLQGWIEINRESGQQVLKDLKRVEDLGKLRVGEIKGRGEQQRKTKLSPPCKHLEMNYSDPESQLLESKHLIKS